MSEDKDADHYPKCFTLFNELLKNYDRDKTSLMKTIEKLQMDLSAMKQKYEEAKRSKQDVLLEVHVYRVLSLLWMTVIMYLPGTIILVLYAIYFA